MTSRVISVGTAVADSGRVNPIAGVILNVEETMKKMTS